MFESIIVQQTLKATLHCHCHILIWIVEQCCVVFASTQCRILLSKFGAVFNTRSGPINDKLAEILVETSTSLVESTDSSMKDVSATQLCLALEHSHKYILTVLHQSLPVPQLNAIALIPASSISSVSSSAWRLAMPRAFAPVRVSRSTPDLQWIFS